MAFNTQQQAQQRYESLQDRLKRLDGLNDHALGSTGMSVPDFKSMPAGVDPNAYIEKDLGMANSSYATRKGASDEANGLLDLLATIEQRNKDNSYKDRELALKEGEGVDTNALLDLRKKLKDAGLSTAQVDAKLKVGGIDVAAEEATKIQQEATGLIDELLGRDTKKITGLVGGTLPSLLGLLPDAVTTTAKRDQLIGKLSLEARSLLKGSGAISDKETKMLEQSVAALKPGMSDEDFKAELKKIRGALNPSSKTKPKVGGFTIEEVK